MLPRAAPHSSVAHHGKKEDQSLVRYHAEQPGVSSQDPMYTARLRLMSGSHTETLHRFERTAQVREENRGKVLEREILYLASVVSVLATNDAG